MVTENKRARWGRAGIFVVLAALSATACNLVLGIGSATHDPSLDDAGPCPAYCQTLATNCTGSNAEYLGLSDCEAMCAQFDPGQPTDTTGDSLSCRMHFAQLAAGDPVTNCQKAGPLAGDGCTDPCHSFCELVADLCDADGYPPYDGGTPACLSACSQYAYWLTTTDPYPAGADAGCTLLPVGDATCDGTNSLNCRLWHLESAYSGPNEPPTHCPHTALSSPVCY